MPPAEAPPPGLAQLAAAEETTASVDKVAALRALGARLRDLRLEMSVADEHAAQLRRNVQAIEQREMPDLMIAAGTDVWGVVPDGNKPGLDLELSRYCHASIGAEWDAERRAQAFFALEQLGAADLIRHTVSIEFKKEEHKEAV